MRDTLVIPYVLKIILLLYSSMTSSHSMVHYIYRKKGLVVRYVCRLWHIVSLFWRLIMSGKMSKVLGSQLIKELCLS